VILTTIQSCKKDEINIANRTGDKLAIEIPEPTKVGFFIDSSWFAKNYKGYKKISNRRFGAADFNKDGLKDLVISFASNGTREYKFQDDTTKRVVVGVFINRKTWFQLDTNLVYSYLGGYEAVNVSDINNDGYIDCYQLTGTWEGSSQNLPHWYNNINWGAMDNFVFINNKNKGFTKYVLKTERNEGPKTYSVIADLDKNGIKEIYNEDCRWVFNGQSFNKEYLTYDRGVYGVQMNGMYYDISIQTPRIYHPKYGVLFISSVNHSRTYYISKVVGNKIVPFIKFYAPMDKFGPSNGTNCEFDEMLVEDLNGDGNDEFIMSMYSSSGPSDIATPHLQIIDFNGNDVTNNYLSINNPLTNEQFNGGLNNVTGFLYYLYDDIDGDGHKEIFPASGIGYKHNNQTYYLKLVNKKYELKLWHSGWYGDINKSVNDYNTNYSVFTEAKNRVNLFIPYEYKTIENIVIKSF